MIKILVDSASDCREESGLYDMYIPIKVNVDGVEYRDGVDISSNEFYRKLETADEFPRTSQPSPHEFEMLFKQIQNDGDELIYIAISSALSGTYQGAMFAKRSVGYEGIHIIDSKCVTHMIGILAQRAYDMRDAGKSAQEIVKECEALKSRIKIFAAVDTLEYLKKGGRLSGASAAVGELVKIKPVVTTSPEGEVATAAKCLGRAKVMQFLLDSVTNAQRDEAYPVYTLYTYGQENCELLEAKLKEKGIVPRDRLQIGATIGAHVGPGVCAVMYVEK